MNITFLIGNGFDVNLGLKTRYVNFYKYYTNLEDTDAPEVVKRFKSEINDFIKRDSKKQSADLIDWRDLEVALGKWTAKITAEEVEPLYLDIIDSLRDYLKSEFKYFDVSAFSEHDFLKYLLDPVLSRVYMQRWRNHPSLRCIARPLRYVKCGRIFLVV